MTSIMDEARWLSKSRREKVIRVRGNKCERCGFDDVDALTVHHLDMNRENNVIGNLQVLCANCHQILHAPTKRSKELRKTLQSAYHVAQDMLESSTVVVKRSGVMRHTSIRLDGGVWGGFRDVCRREGLSTCNVLEGLLIGWVVGLNSTRAQRAVTVMVDNPRIVKRVRRRQIYFEDESAPLDPPVVECEGVQATVFCQFCFRPALPGVVAEHKKSGIKAFVCERHRKELKEHPKWKIVGGDKNGEKKLL